MIDIMAQVWIACFGMTSIFMVNRGEKWCKKWAPIIGLIGQPAWFVTTISNEQWGLVALVSVYTWSWGYGIYDQWYKKEVS